MYSGTTVSGGLQYNLSFVDFHKEIHINLMTGPEV